MPKGPRGISCPHASDDRRTDPRRSRRRGREPAQTPLGRGPGASGEHSASHPQMTEPLCESGFQSRSPSTLLGKPCKSECTEVAKRTGLTLLPASPRVAQPRPMRASPHCCRRARCCQGGSFLAPCTVLSPELRDRDGERLGGGQTGTLDGPDGDADPSSCIEASVGKPTGGTLGTPRLWTPRSGPTGSPLGSTRRPRTPTPQPAPRPRSQWWRRLPTWAESRCGSEDQGETNDRLEPEQGLSEQTEGGRQYSARCTARRRDGSQLENWATGGGKDRAAAVTTASLRKPQVVSVRGAVHKRSRRGLPFRV